MLSIRKIFGFFNWSTTASSKEKSNLEQTSYPKELLDELNEIVVDSGVEQKERRDSFIQDSLMYYSESELVNALSEIYTDAKVNNSIKDQAAFGIQALIASRTNMDLHGFISDEIYHPVARKWAINELIERHDISANLTFIYRVIVDSDDSGVRKLAAFGLGVIGGKAALEVLGKVQPADPIYNEAQKAKNIILEKFKLAG